MKGLEGWVSNSIIAVLAAVFSILQEVWVGTEPNVLAFAGLGCSCAIALSLATEIFKCVFIKFHRWTWGDVFTGALVGVIAAIAIAFSCVL